MTKKMIPPTLSVKSEKMGKSLSGPRLAGSLLMLSLASMTCWAKSIMTMAPNATQKNTSRKQCLFFFHTRRHIVNTRVMQVRLLFYVFLLMDLP